MNAEQKFDGRCYCGAVKVTVTGLPAMSAICHCASCRKWHAAPMNAFSAWPSASVELPADGTIVSTESPDSGRVSCAKCGGCVANIKPRAKMTVVYPMVYAGSGLRYEPTAHIFYAERVIDVADNLPKFVDLPIAAGGSGDMVNEPLGSGWLVTD